MDPDPYGSGSLWIRILMDPDLYGFGSLWIRITNTVLIQIYSFRLVEDLLRSNGLLPVPTYQIKVLFH